MSELKSKLVKTKDIDKAIDEFASLNSIESSEFDFKIKKIETYIKDSSNSEFALFNEDIKEHYDEERIINEHVELTQIYTIIINK